MEVVLVPEQDTDTTANTSDCFNPCFNVSSTCTKMQVQLPGKLFGVPILVLIQVQLSYNKVPFSTYSLSPKVPEFV